MPSGRLFHRAQPVPSRDLRAAGSRLPLAKTHNWNASNFSGTQAEMLASFGETCVPSDIAFQPGFGGGSRRAGMESFQSRDRITNLQEPSHCWLE